MFGWITTLVGFAGKVLDWWNARQQQKHDDAVRQEARTGAALEGTNDALKQVDTVNRARDDAGDDGVRDDPLNRNRQRRP